MLIQEVDLSARVGVRCDIHRQKYICRKHIHYFAELVLVLDGKLTVSVNGKTETAEKNQFIFLFPFQKHEYTSDEVSYFLICTFPMSILLDFAAKASGKSGKRAVFNASPLTVELFKEKFVDTEKTTVYGVNCCLQAMLDDFYSQVELTESDTDNNAMDRLTRYISKNYKNQLPLHDVAQALGYSPNYLSHCIFKTLGMNYRTLLGSTRSEYARIMLATTNLSVLEIAMECGFPNLRSLQRHFKDFMGVSPSDYRKQLSKAKARSDKNNVEHPPRRVRKDIVI